MAPSQSKVLCDFKIVTIFNIDIVPNAHEHFITFKLYKNRSLLDGGQLYICPSSDGPDGYSFSDSGLHMPDDLRGSIPTSTGTASTTYNNIPHSLSFYYNNKKESPQLINYIHNKMKRYLKTLMPGLNGEYEAKSDVEKRRDTTEANKALYRQQKEQQQQKQLFARDAETAAALVAAAAETARAATAATAAATAAAAAAATALTTPTTRRMTHVRQKAFGKMCNPENEDDRKRGAKVHELVTSTNPDIKPIVDSMFDDSFKIPVSTGGLYNGLAAAIEHGTIAVQSSKGGNKKKKKGTKKRNRDDNDDDDDDSDDDDDDNDDDDDDSDNDEH